MFKLPESRLAATSAALLAADSFVVPMTLRSDAASSRVAATELERAFDDARGFITGLKGLSPEVTLVGLDEPVSGQVSRVELLQDGKQFRFDLTFSLRIPFPDGLLFFDRIQLVSSVYDRIANLSQAFEGRRGIDFAVEQARLESWIESGVSV
jgi:hypothetical protein